MSTYIQLVQDLHREAGISGNTPTSVVGATGETLRLANWIKAEWNKIQNRHPNWRWMRKSFTLQTVASDDTYSYSDCTDDATSSAITRFSHFLPDGFKIYLTSSGVGTQGWLTYINWDDFKQIFKIGSQNPSYPTFVAFDPDNNIVLGAKPDGIYTVTGDYQRSPQILSADSDTPEMPSQYHDLIMLGALRRYAAYESAPEVYGEAQAQYSDLMKRLDANQLPEPRFAAPLA